MSSTNPYSPPQLSMDTRDESWYRVRVESDYRRMGWGMIIYITLVASLAIYEIWTNDKLSTGEIIGPAILLLVMWTFFGMMVYTAGQLATDFDRVYNRARWLGILAGAVLFPLLTIPAFIAVRRLSVCRKIRAEANATE